MKRALDVDVHNAATEDHLKKKVPADSSSEESIDPKCIYSCDDVQRAMSKLRKGGMITDNGVPTAKVEDSLARSLLWHIIAVIQSIGDFEDSRCFLHIEDPDAWIIASEHPTSYGWYGKDDKISDVLNDIYTISVLSKKFCKWRDAYNGDTPPCRKTIRDIAPSLSSECTMTLDLGDKPTGFTAAVVEVDEDDIHADPYYTSSSDFDVVYDALCVHLNFFIERLLEKWPEFKSYLGADAPGDDDD